MRLAFFVRAEEPIDSGVTASMNASRIPDHNDGLLDRPVQCPYNCVIAMPQLDKCIRSAP